jgi:hypothetical protein
MQYSTLADILQLRSRSPVGARQALIKHSDRSEKLWLGLIGSINQVK